MKTYDEILNLEARKCFDFFWNETNIDTESPAYGMIRDGSGDENRDMGSIASVGFGLSAIIIGIERGWITKKEGYERTLGTLKSFYKNIEHVSGFFYHFIDMNTGKQYGPWADVPSIIDTSLFLNGAITSAEYFGDEIRDMFEKIYHRVDWQMYYNKKNNQFYMGWREGEGGFEAWDTYAEQLMIYILGVGSETYPVPAEIYNGFERIKGKYKEYEFITAINNPLFTHQFSHAWYDFEKVEDTDGINWFNNSVKASLAQYQYAKDNPSGFETYKTPAWGNTACDGPQGYRAYGSPEYITGREIEKFDDGTIAPCASLGSIVFTPDQVKEAVEYFYHEIPELWGKYGFLDAYNQENGLWIANRVIGIDKGITLLMIENARTGLIWDLYMGNEIVKRGAAKIGLREVE